jgi:hypothetical protein
MSAVKRGEDEPVSTPETLYKYFPPERIDALENLELRFSKPSEFNDTFDSHYLVPKDGGSKAKLDRIRLRGQLGVFCLTERPDNHLMWVHYARNHTGFILGFDTSAPFFTNDGRILEKVRYRDTPKVVRAAGLDACLFKSKAWQHEEEWRCVGLFKPSEPRSVGIEPKSITQIIFGSQMAAWQVARVMLFATAYDMRATQFALSVPSRKNWTIQIQPKFISLCEHCGGDGYAMSDPEA